MFSLVIIFAPRKPARFRHTRYSCRFVRSKHAFLGGLQSVELGGAPGGVDAAGVEVLATQQWVRQGVSTTRWNATAIETRSSWAGRGCSEGHKRYHR